MNRTYQICTRCIMDTSDPGIQFDTNGVCNHCHAYDELVRQNVFSGAAGEQRLKALVDEIKRAGSNKEYDCIIGVSGGVDSTYTAYKVKQLGLRPLAVHLDNGWNSELAVHNITKTLNKLGIDLYTCVLDWEEFRDLQLAFLRASTPDSEIPTDHAITAILCHTASKYGTKYILWGANIRTETHLPGAWSQGHMDWKYIYSVQKLHGHKKLKTFPHMNFWRYHWYWRTQKRISILDYLDYVKRDATQVLQDELGWQYYGGKHYESIYTRFYQGYILPKKFGYDKRRSHLSSLICSGEISRDHALEELEDDPYPLDLQEEDKAYVIKKLGITQAEFDNIIQLPKKSYWDYPSYGTFYKGVIFKGARGLYRSLKTAQAT